MVRVKQPGLKGARRRPKEEWILVDDAHEAIITRAEYEKAHEAIRRGKQSDVPIDHIFHGKIKCPVCRHTLTRLNPKRPYFKCKTHYFTDYYDCPDGIITQEKLEKMVLESIQVHAAVLIEDEELKLAVLQKERLSKADMERKIKSERRAVQVLEESATKNITALVAGEITPDIFLRKKEIICNTVSQKNAEIERICKQLQMVTEGSERVEEKLAGLRPLVNIEKLDRALVDFLIEKVVVYDEKEIEIVWIGDEW